MTWKVYAAMSGATVMAGWLASAPPSDAPGTGASASSQATLRRTPPSPDIEREALRLQARVRREMAYAEPQRNLFRFGAARPIVSAEVEAPVAEPPTDRAPAAPPPPPPPVSLAGIAEDQFEQRVERMAILSSREGVLLVHEGDDVLGQYRVVKIDAEAVDLVTLVDGSTLRLGFAP